MADYKEKFERWTKKATDKLEEMDSQYDLKGKIEGGAKAVYDTAKTGAEYIKTEAEKSDTGKRAVKVVEDVANTAGSAAKTAWNVSEPVRDAAVDAGKKTGGIVVDTAEKASDVVSGGVGDVGTNAKRVLKVVGFGSSLSTTLDELPSRH